MIAELIMYLLININAVVFASDIVSMVNNKLKVPIWMIQYSPRHNENNLVPIAIPVNENNQHELVNIIS